MIISGEQTLEPTAVRRNEGSDPNERARAGYKVDVIVEYRELNWLPVIGCGETSGGIPHGSRKSCCAWISYVLFRVFMGRGERRAHATKKNLWAISDALVPRRRAFDFNQGLMDFGAMLCTARKPKCLICPMASICAAYPHNPEHEQ